MRTTFSEILRIINLSANEELAGYSDDEIVKLEKLYDIFIVGNLKKFLSLAGRCSGGVIGDRDIVLYLNDGNLRSHFLFQIGCREELSGLGLFDILTMKPFFFAVESETVYYFLQTKAQDREQVYLYDENTEEVRKTDWDFAAYIEYQISETSKHMNNIICKSDMLLI
ncbi:MAG: SMI1/KNR4 family protein [Cyanobacteria bacterium P01_A01_bin.83]